MKADRCTLLLGTIGIAIVVMLGERRGHSPAIAGTACCPLTYGLRLPGTNACLLSQPNSLDHPRHLVEDGGGVE
jgi:hypothetical protein